MPSNYAIIMAGGVGSRFWPYSTSKKPKQFLDILSTGRSLLQMTVDRIEGLVDADKIFIVTNMDYLGLVKEQLPLLNGEQILLEPCMRNTAPCIAYASYKISQKDPDACVMVLPADHLIIKEEKFRQLMSDCLDYTSQNDAIGTLGIQPTRPDQGYGYIKYDKNEQSYFKNAQEFTEKPNAERAEKFFQSGEYAWNAGIFIWNVQTVKKAFAEYLPEVHEAFAGISHHFFTKEEQQIVDELYPQLPSISIDYAIMEKADNVFVRKAEIGWSDLGTWKSLYENATKDSNNNVLQGTVSVNGTNGCVIMTDKTKLLVAKDINDTIIVEKDGIMVICSKDSEQEIKKIVSDLKKSGNSTLL